MASALTTAVLLERRRRLVMGCFSQFDLDAVIVHPGQIASLRTSALMPPNFVSLAEHRPAEHPA